MGTKTSRDGEARIPADPSTGFITVWLRGLGQDTEASLILTMDGCSLPDESQRERKPPSHVCTGERRGLRPAVPSFGCRGRSLPGNAQVSLRLLIADLVGGKAIKPGVGTLPAATLSYMEDLRC